MKIQQKVPAYCPECHCNIGSVYTLTWCWLCQRDWHFTKLEFRDTLDKSYYLDLLVDLEYNRIKMSLMKHLLI